MRRGSGITWTDSHSTQTPAAASLHRQPPLSLSLSCPFPRLHGPLNPTSHTTRCACPNDHIQALLDEGEAEGGEGARTPGEGLGRRGGSIAPTGTE